MSQNAHDNAAFIELRTKFLNEHKRDIDSHIGKHIGNGYSLMVTPMGKDVQDRFMEATRQHRCKLIPCLHGTNQENYSSIFTKGLLVGGSGGIGIANGAAYGNGVYVANLNCPSLSLGFARPAKELLVCIVLTSPQVVKPHRDAQLVQNSDHVIPAFLATSPAGNRDFVQALSLWNAGKQAEEGRAAGLNARAMREAGYHAVQLQAAGFTNDQVLRAGFQAAALKGLYNVGNLLKAGYATSDLQEAGFPANEVMRATCDAKELKTAGYSAVECLEMCSVESLYLAGFTVTELQAADVPSKALFRAGVSATDMKAGGYGFRDMVSAGYRAQALCDAEFSDAEMVSAFSPKDLKKCGYTAEQLYEQNCKANDLRAGGYTVGDCQRVGCSREEILYAGFDAKPLAQAGFSFEEVFEAGYGAIAMRIDAQFPAWQIMDNYDVVDLRMAGYTAVEVKKGKTLENPAKVLKAAGYTPASLRKADFEDREILSLGYSASDMLENKQYTVKVLLDNHYPLSDLCEAGCRAEELLNAGIEPKQIKGAGFSSQQLVFARPQLSVENLKDIGYSDSEVLRAGLSAKDLCAARYSPADLKEAGYSEEVILCAGYDEATLLAAGYDTPAEANPSTPIDVAAWLERD